MSSTHQEALGHMPKAAVPRSLGQISVHINRGAKGADSGADSGAAPFERTCYLGTVRTVLYRKQMMRTFALLWSGTALSSRVLL